jgi:hypothetical protein
MIILPPLKSNDNVVPLTTYGISISAERLGALIEKLNVRIDRLNRLIDKSRKNGDDKLRQYREHKRELCINFHSFLTYAHKHGQSLNMALHCMVGTELND